MRIYCYSYNYAPELVGIAVYNTGMAIWLAQQKNYEIAFHTGLPHYPWWEIPASYKSLYKNDELDHGVSVNRVKHYIPKQPITGIKRMAFDLSWLAKTVCASFGARRRPQVICVIAPPFLNGLLGIFLSWRWRVPVIYHVQDLQIDVARDLKMLPPWLMRPMRVMEAFIFRHVDMITTISPAMLRCVRDKGVPSRKTALFPNWVSPIIERYCPGQQREATCITIMYAGSLGKKQGLEFLLRAFAQVRRQTKQAVRLIIAGNGHERTALEQVAHEIGNDDVTFCDLVEEERLADFLYSGDIHVIPQRRAAAGLVMPSKLLNILGVGRPVVVTADQGTDLANAVIHSAGGLVCEPENVPALAEAILTFVSNPQRRADCGRAGREYVLAHYTRERILSTFVAQVTDLLQHHNHARSAFR
jgi:colanic acid biosynthesis glycosyl transferase WcaI